MVLPTIFKIREQVALNFLWIGWPGIIPETVAEKEQIERLLAAQKCRPIWLEKHELEDMILFQEQFLRPLFHNFKGTNERDIDDLVVSLWRNYNEVNEKFVDAYLALEYECKMIWVHDIQLLMTP
jgi:trehalose 6-phosphate synthase/phosphatase